MTTSATQWKALTRDQRRAWSAWAKANTMTLPDGARRRVSGQRALAEVLKNRATAGASASPTVLPASTTWLDGALTMSNAGPWTENAGYIGFRVEQELVSATKWFVWATPPVDGTESNPHRLLRFVKCLSLNALALDALIPSFGNDYLAVLGSWDGPGVEGEWPSPKFIWFRLHHYANGVLSPGVMMKGQVEVEL